MRRIESFQPFYDFGFDRVFAIVNFGDVFFVVVLANIKIRLAAGNGQTIRDNVLAEQNRAFRKIGEIFCDNIADGDIIQIGILYGDVNRPNVSFR